MLVLAFSRVIEYYHSRSFCNSADARLRPSSSRLAGMTPTYWIGFSGMLLASTAMGWSQCASSTAPVNVQTSVFATGTGLQANPGVSCKNASDNPSGLADPTGTYNSICPVRNAALYAASCTDAGALPPLYFPTGHYKFNTSGTAGVLVFNGSSIGVVGDGPAASILENDSKYAALLTYVNVYEPSVAGVTLEGNGPNTYGDLLDVVSSQAGSYTHVALANTAGIGINLQGGSERGRFTDINSGGVRLPFNSEGNTNENYLTGFDFSFNGETGYNGNADHNWHYDSSANPWTGIEITTTCASSTPAAWSASTSYSANQTVSFNNVTYNSIVGNSGDTPQLVSQYWQQCGQQPFPEERANVYLDGDNWLVTNGSIKGAKLSGINVARTTAQVSHIYFEGTYNDPIPDFAYSTQVLGKQEIGHIIGAVSASSLTFPVDDAGWQHIYVSDPNLVGQLATDNVIAVFPSDYLAGSSAQSAAVPGLLRGQYEQVVIGFAGDNALYPAGGTGHASARAQNGTVAPGVACGSQSTNCGPGLINAPVAYPAPSLIGGVTTPSALIAQFPNTTYGVVELQENHFNTVKRNQSAAYVPCSDTQILTPNAQWIGNPSLDCAENFAGAVPDGITVLIPGSPGAKTYSASINYQDNSIFTDTTSPEMAGIGWIKIASNANVQINQGDPLLTSLVAAPIAFETYVNGTEVQLVNWGGNAANAITASGTITDSSAHVLINNAGSLQNIFNAYTSEASNMAGSSTPSTETITAGPSCTYLSQDTSTTVPTLRTCIDPTTGLLSTQLLYKGNWVAAPGTAHVYSELVGSTGSFTLAAAPSGTVPGDDVLRATCNNDNVGKYVGGGYFGGFQNPANLATQLFFSPGLPPGIVYGFDQFGYGQDPTNGVYGNGISIHLCNTTNAAVAISNSTMTITQTF